MNTASNEVVNGQEARDAGLPSVDRQPQRLQALESLRGVASVYIFFHHFVQYEIEETYPQIRRLFVFGQAAVMLFFLLSGFVIYYSARPDSQQVFRFRPYFIRRFRRIYPPFVLTLAVTYALHSFAEGRLIRIEPIHLIGNLLLQQDYGKPGNWVGPFLSNSPLWSLSYEWFFYMAFFPIISLMRNRPTWRVWAVAAISIIGVATYAMLPNQISLFASYFVLWWAGVELAREYVSLGTITFRGQWPSIMSMATICCVWGIWAWFTPGRTAYTHPTLQFRHFATTLVLLVLWVAVARSRNSLRQRAAHAISIFQLAAPISYALYIVHEPILRFCATEFQELHPLALLPLAATAVVAVSYLIEQVLQPRISACLPAR